MYNNTIHTDIEYLYTISSSLERFKQRGRRNVWNCRCPVCGDSKRKRRKARFYFYEKSGANSLLVTCKNCGYSTTFYCFLKEYYPDDFSKYKKQIFTDKVKKNKVIKSREEESKPLRYIDELKWCVPILTLDNNHVALKYMRSRSFSDKELQCIFYTDDFKQLAEYVSGESTSEDFPVEARIVIPFYTKDGKVKAIQGRSLNPKSSMKYITIKSDENVDKIYGEERVDNSKTLYCVEGPFDSLFVDNCIATCDASLTKAKADVYVWDNQPRNEEVVAAIKEALQSGYSVVIWPNSPDSKIDINDIIKMGVTKDVLMGMLKARTFKGARGLLELTKWKKV